MADLGSVGHEACVIAQGIGGPLPTNNSITGARDACRLGQGIGGPLPTQDSITGARDACRLGQGILIRSAIIAWTTA